MSEVYHREAEAMPGNRAGEDRNRTYQSPCEDQLVLKTSRGTSPRLLPWRRNAPFDGRLCGSRVSRERPEIRDLLMDC
jgi:hypothetical protein